MKSTTAKYANVEGSRKQSKMENIESFENQKASRKSNI